MDKAVILDRDGTLIFDSGYVYRVKDFKLLPGVIEGLKSLSKQFIFIINIKCDLGFFFYCYKN